MAFIGGYFWNYKVVNDAAAIINVYLCASATLCFKIGSEEVRLTQETEYPLRNKIAFHLDAPKKVSAMIRLRIPSWAKIWEVRTWLFVYQISFTNVASSKMTPALPSSSHLNASFLTIPASYLARNADFILTVPLTPRLIAPHRIPICPY